MSDLASLMSPAAPPASSPKTPEASGQLESKWKTFLKNPAVQSALLQFSVNMMQPRVPGQTALGQIGTSIGAAGAAAGRNIEAEQKRQQQALENTNKEKDLELRERQVKTGESAVGVQNRQIDVELQKMDMTADSAEQDRVSREAVAKIGLEATMAQIKAQLESNERVQNRALLQEIIRSETERFKAESEDPLRGAIDPNNPDSPAKTPAPPTPGSIMQTYQLLEGALSNGGRLPDAGANSLVKDDEVVRLLKDPNPTEQAKGTALLRFLSQTQIARIMALVGNQATPAMPPLPGTGSSIVTPPATE